MIISGTEIELMRGDNDSLTVTRRDKETKNIVPFEAGDKIYFTVKTSTETEEKEFQIVVESFIEGSAIVSFLPEHTRSMRQGRYYYDIQLTDKSGLITTLVKSRIKIEGDVTYE